MQTSPSDSKNVLTQQCDVLVIGAGLAGLTTALCLPSHLNIIVLAKDELSACSATTLKAVLLPVSVPATTATMFEIL